jgi:hypothetical protein
MQTHRVTLLPSQVYFSTRANKKLFISIAPVNLAQWEKPSHKTGTLKKFPTH